MPNDPSPPPKLEDILFSPAVKAAQQRLGSRDMFERRGAWRCEITDEVQQYLAAVDTFFIATASGDGRPYLQHRGGPAGFLKVLDNRTLGFADFGGNRQYITTGHLQENDRAFLFVPHFATRQRVKFWGRARVVEEDGDLLARLAIRGYSARIERVIVFDVEAWDSNCQSHITARYSEAEIAPAIDKLVARIKELEAEVERLRGQSATGA